MATDYYDSYYWDDYHKKLLTCDCCTEALSKLIRRNFEVGDIIGLTFIEQGVASIATGIFQKVVDGVVVVKDLLLEDTISYVQLCDVSSVEKGIIETQASESPISISLTK
ncbi:hypothetical protein [Wukongibacter sp. M2B1]|uniref:hypothetical protein n=1 Tax=Wukongibacter sp. M2B1 TaxID=3088895 RepID=UPI003D7B10C6